MRRRMMIPIDETVDGEFKLVVERRKSSPFLQDLPFPHVTSDELVDGYRAMAADQERECEALKWSEALVGDILMG